jgi:hypothetical protein
MKEFAANRREEKPEFQDIQDLRGFTRVPESALSNSRPERRREDAVVGAPLRCASLRHMEGILFCPLPALVPQRAWRAEGPYRLFSVMPSLGELSWKWPEYFLAYLRETMLDSRFDSRL